MGPTSAVRNWTAAVAGLAAVLCALMAVVGPGIFTIDEQAYRFQTDLVDDGVWGLPYPTADVIEQDLGAPMSNSELGGETWYPAARHPAYIQLLRAGRLVDDAYGPVLISILGVLMTAIGVEQVARWLGRVPHWAAFWFAGLGSPAAFHGLVTWAHAPALGLVSIGLALMLRAAPRRPVVTAAAVLALAGAVLLRSDGPLAIAAIGAGLLTGVGTDRQHLYRLAATGTAGVAGLAAGSAWHASIVDPDTTAGAGSGRAVDIGRYLTNGIEIFLYPGGDLAILRVLSVALLATAVLWYRRVGPAGAPVTVALAAVATALGLAGSFHDSTYGSLLPAAPLIVVGIIGLLHEGQDRRSRPPADEDRDRNRRLWMLAVMAVVAMVGPVVATASGGGGLGWGGRYVLLALAPLIPLAVAGAAALWRTPPTRPAVIGALVVTVAVQLAGARTLADYHRYSLAAPPVLIESLAALEKEFELIATFDPRIGRVAPLEASAAPLVSVGSRAELATLLQVAADSDLAAVAVVSLFEPESLELPAGWTEKEYRDQPIHVLVVGP